MYIISVYCILHMTWTMEINVCRWCLFYYCSQAMLVICLLFNAHMALENQLKGSNTRSDRSPMVDEDRMRPSYWLGLGLVFSVPNQCFVIDSWVTRSVSGM